MPLAAGPIQACGVEHRRAAGDRIGEDVAAAIAFPAHRPLLRADAGQLDRIGTWKVGKSLTWVMAVKMAGN